jgi:pimeloyl-ACP methyl ester carboxylesterase
MKHALPARPELGTRDGLAYALFLPPVEPRAGVVICHGAGSAKESHFDFARAAVAYDMAALAFDARGHGRSEGRFGPDAIDDVLSICGLMREHTPRIALRGSSMGGLLALHAAAASQRVAAVVSICPAAEHMIIEDLRRVLRGEPPPPGSALESMRVDAAGLVAWLEEHDVRDAVARLGKPLMLVHARDDEVVPYTLSEELYERAFEPKRLLVLAGGNHRSAQHDPEVQGETLRWLSRVM